MGKPKVRGSAGEISSADALWEATGNAAEYYAGQIFVALCRTEQFPKE